MFGFGKAKAVVGLDIGSSAVKAVELKPSGKGFKVTAFAIEPVPPDSIVDGAIIDGTAVADAIRRLFENKAFKTKEVAASLSGNAVIVKKISLPVMTPTELDESIYWEAEQYIPFDIQDVNLDYQILDAGGGPDAKGTMEVLLVAAKKEKIADYTGVIAQAGRSAHEDICRSLELFAREVMPEFHARESEHARWKADVLSGRLALHDENADTYKLYAHQNEDIVRLTPAELKAKMAAKERA